MTGHDKLIRDIEAKPDSELKTEMLKHVRAFEYHKFKSNRPWPVMQLFVDLGLLGWEDLQDKAGKGEYENKPDED
jgi:hypothetical protein